MENVITHPDVINAIADVMSPFGDMINIFILSALTIYAMSCLPNILLQFIEMMDAIIQGTYDLIKSYVAMGIILFGILWCYATLPEKALLAITVINISLIIKALKKLFYLIQDVFRL